MYGGEAMERFQIEGMREDPLEGLDWTLPSASRIDFDVLLIPSTICRYFSAVEWRTNKLAAFLR